MKLLMISSLLFASTCFATQTGIMGFFYKQHFMECVSSDKTLPKDVCKVFAFQKTHEDCTSGLIPSDECMDVFVNHEKMMIRNEKLSASDWANENYQSIVLQAKDNK
jgi:hypothetical protein